MAREMKSRKGDFLNCRFAWGIKRWHGGTRNQLNRVRGLRGRELLFSWLDGGVRHRHGFCPFERLGDCRWSPGLWATFFSWAGFKTCWGERRNIKMATNKVSGGSAMPLCDIVLPVSKRPTDSKTILFSTLINASLHATHVSISVISCKSSFIHLIAL